MDTLAFDGRMGASGDMLLASLLAVGADRDALTPVEDALDVEYRVGETTKNGIAATTVDVLLTGASADEQRDHDHSHADHDHGDDDHGDDEHGDHDQAHSEDAHSHEHSDHQHSNHSHDHDHADHDHSHADHADDESGHTHAEGAGPTRSYAEVVDIVESMNLPAGVESRALSIFEVLGEAEASVHGTDLTETHFHEVGADDAIADVVGVCLLLDDLGVERVVTTPVAAGSGDVAMSHGTYPIPAPAVAEIAGQADWSLRGGPVEAELLTPTGAAILATIAEGVPELPTLDVQTVGYGAGGYDFPEHPNVLRALRGDGAGGLRRDEITVLETNLDDATPEVLGSLQETLADAGARDVSILPATMKKSRPGHLVKVITKPVDAERVARKLAEETGTLGVREHGAGHRWVAEREFETAEVAVDGESFAVPVKIASDVDGTVYDYSAEYDDALRVARETGLSLREVCRRAEDAVRDE
ncbi:nickel pincer cofactor biosynthesis protein LarC [Salinirubrum litoreum]|uniref:Putative nickel insertion protein n=1 Tax=Salinirubrum litoreum TaxID=1126234 RepID=A0ABD5REF9_9EURY|nr:nickel pincer cofactor biosynthesis protein LarC [Salinirubrum litoreum]